MTEITPVKKSASPTYWIAIVAAVAFIERLIVLALYQPVSFSDTPSYRRLADTVLQGFANYDGTRTPGYPVFLAVTGSDQGAWVAQLILGFIATLLLFFIGWKLSGKPWFGGLAALLHTLNLQQLLFESNLLTESLTTFMLILTLAGVLAWVTYPKLRRIWLAFVLGLFSSIALLIRPLFIYLPFLLLLFLFVEGRLTRHTAPQPGAAAAESLPAKKGHLPIPHIISFLIPVVALIAGWTFFIHKNFGDWSLTTMTGYHLVQHTGNFFEYVPDEYATLRDIYIRYRDAQISEFGTQTNAIWDAIPEMSQATGYSFYALSRVLTRISIQLILDHPFLYIKNAISGWWMFWRVPVYWSAEALRFSWMAGGIKLLIQVERVMIFTANLVFIFGSIYFLIVKSMSALRLRSSPFSNRTGRPTRNAILWLILATIWIASILQTLLDHGDNPRFLVPLQSLALLWVAAFVLQLSESKQASSTNSSQA